MLTTLLLTPVQTFTTRTPDQTSFIGHSETTTLLLLRRRLELLLLVESFPNTSGILLNTRTNLRPSGQDTYTSGLTSGAGGETGDAGKGPLDLVYVSTQLCYTKRPHWQTDTPGYTPGPEGLEYDRSGNLLRPFLGHGSNLSVSKRGQGRRFVLRGNPSYLIYRRGRGRLRRKSRREDRD